MKKVLFLLCVALCGLGVSACGNEAAGSADTATADEKAILYGQTDMDALYASVPQEYRLIISGNTAQELTFSGDQFKEELKENMIEATYDFVYTPGPTDADNGEPTLSTGSYTTTGVPLKQLLRQAEAGMDTVGVIIRGTNGVEQVLPLEAVPEDAIIRWHDAVGFQYIYPGSDSEPVDCANWIKYVQVIIALDKMNYETYLQQNELWNGQVFSFEAMLERRQPVELPADYNLLLHGQVVAEVAVPFEELKSQVWLTDYVKVYPYILQTELESLQGGVIVAGLPLRDIVAEAGINDKAAAFTVRTLDGDVMNFNLAWLYYDYPSQLDMVLTYADGLGLCLVYPSETADGQIDATRWLYGVSEIEFIDKATAEAKGFTFE